MGKGKKTTQKKKGSKSKLEVNKQDGMGRTRLHLYCQDERVEDVRSLVEDFKADIYIQDSYGFSAIYQAIRYGNVKTTEYLVTKYGPDFSDGEIKHSLLHHAATVAEKNSEALIDVILDAGGNIDIEDCDGVPPLVYAISYYNLKTVKHLLKRGANKNMKVIPPPTSEIEGKVTIEKVTEIFINEFENSDSELQIMKKINKILKSK